MPPRKNRGNSSSLDLDPSGQVLRAVNELSSSVLDLKNDVVSAVKQLSVLQERQDGSRQFLDEKFRHIEQRMETDARAIGVRLNEDRSAIDKLTNSMTKVEGEVANLSKQLTSNTSQTELAKHDERIKTIENEILLTKGALKTMDWIWKAIGSAVVAGILGVAYFIVKHS